jgi:2-polyprenyl-3-methyl-5-hydroxy-6-metoxy-1,4-benzoquinol methylase
MRVECRATGSHEAQPRESLTNVNSAVRDMLIGVPAYKQLRFVYQSLFDRRAVVRRKRRREFYSAFIHPGDLVFDVGVHLGNYAEALCGLGATVVAIEPDPRNVKILRKRLKDRYVRIEQCALGRNGHC